MLTIQNLSYTYPGKEPLFSSLDLAVNAHDKIALIGNNGVGKSTLLKIIAQELSPTDGQISLDSAPYYIPQIFGQYNHLTVAQALRVQDKLNALEEILKGNISEQNFTLLNDDWTIEDRCHEAMAHWGLADVMLSQKMELLSGGQKTKVFLAAMMIHQPDLILLDEPTNHLDLSGRELLYAFIRSAKSTLIIVSHDRKLLNLLTRVCELSKTGIRSYGGDYDFYKEQKELELNALNQELDSKEKAYKKAKEKERETIERQQKLDARAKKNLGKAGLPKIVANTWKNSAEKSSAKIKDVHAEKTGNIRQEIQELRDLTPANDLITFAFDNAKLHRGKILFSATDMNISYRGEEYVWKENLTIQVSSGERIAIKGSNGSGKTTLIKAMLGKMAPTCGEVFIAEYKSVYIDQEYSLISNHLSIYEQASQFNTSALQEHEIKIRLARFLFTKDDWNKLCGDLSGGEKMRLMVCCLNIAHQAPDMIILDEPTNNLDIQNIDILTKAINDYQGTLIVISHDDTFLEEIRTERTISL